MIQIIDAHDLMSRPPAPMQWAVDGLIPFGVLTDIFAPPGVGKTTLMTDLGMAVAGEGGSWHGRQGVHRRAGGDPWRRAHQPRSPQPRPAPHGPPVSRAWRAGHPNRQVWGLPAALALEPQGDGRRGTLGSDRMGGRD